MLCVGVLYVSNSAMASCQCAVVLEHLRLLCSCVSAIASYVVLSSAIWKVVLSCVSAVVSCVKLCKCSGELC